MSEKSSVTLTFGYKDTDFTRKYRFDGLSAAVLADAKDKILALNASIKAGNDGGLTDFFVSDDFDDSDSQNVIGTFAGIVEAHSDETVTQYIYPV